MDEPHAVKEIREVIGRGRSGRRYVSSHSELSTTIAYIDTLKQWIGESGGITGYLLARQERAATSDLIDKLKAENEEVRENLSRLRDQNGRLHGEVDSLINRNGRLQAQIDFSTCSCRCACGQMQPPYDITCKGGGA